MLASQGMNGRNGVGLVVRMSPVCYPPEMHETPQNAGRGLVLLAAILWSTSGLFAKAPFLDQWPAEQRGLLLAFWRAAFAGLALLPFVRRPQWTWRLLPAAASFAIMNATFLLAMTFTTAANAIWLQYTAPLWVFLVGTFLLGEVALRRDVWMVTLGMLGVGVILWCEWNWGPATNTHRWGAMWGLAAGVSFASVMLSLRYVRDLPGVWVICICHLSAAILLAPLVIPRYGLALKVTTLTWLAAFGILQMAIPYLLFARGLRYLTGHEASCITLLEPLLVPAWVFLLWRNSPGYQPPSWWTWLGAGLILAGLLVRYWPLRTTDAAPARRE